MLEIKRPTSAILLTAISSIKDTVTENLCVVVPSFPFFYLQFSLNNKFACRCLFPILVADISCKGPLRFEGDICSWLPSNAPCVFCACWYVSYHALKCTTVHYLIELFLVVLPSLYKWSKLYIWGYIQIFSNNYRLLYSWLYNTEIYLDKCLDDYYIGRANRRFQYSKVIWARVQIYFGIVQSTVW